MNPGSTATRLAEFFRRDLRIARSYRAAFLFETLESLFGVASFYYLSRFVDSPQLAAVTPGGTNYFAFAFVGFAFFDCLGVSLYSFDRSLQQARGNGTLEHLLVTETGLPLILAGSVLYPMAVMLVRMVVYLAWGVFLFGFTLRAANWAGALAILLVSVLAFAGLGVLSACYVLLFKRGNPITWFLLGVSGLVSGMMYPVSVLPDWLQTVSRLVPVTYSLEGMRAAVLAGASLAQLWPSLRALLLFAALLLPLSYLAFDWALRRTKVTGTLTHS